VVESRILDIRPQLGFRVSSDFYIGWSAYIPFDLCFQHTVVVGTDVKTSSLTSRDGLGQAEERCAQCSDSLLEKDGTSIHGGSGGRNLDAETIFRDTDLLKLSSIVPSMLHHLVCIVCVEWGGLE